MRRFAVEILPEAEAEIREAFLWYFERSPTAAEAFRTETLEAIDRLGANALMWPEDEDAIRRHVLRHFPYTVFYQIHGSTVTVLAIAHQRRKPRYWRKRYSRFGLLFRRPTFEVRGARPGDGDRRQDARMSTIAKMARWPGVPLDLAVRPRRLALGGAGSEGTLPWPS